MSNSQEFTTIVRLNAQEAKNELETLTKRVNDLRTARDNAIKSNSESSFIKDLNRELKSAETQLRGYSTNVNKTIETINNLSTASVGDIQKAMRGIRSAMKDVSSPEEFKQLDELLERCKQRLTEIKQPIAADRQQMEEARQAAQNMYRALLNIDSASFDELNAGAEALKKKLNSMHPNTAAWEQTNAELLKVNARIDQIKAKQQQSNTTVDKYNAELKDAGLQMKQVRNNTELVNRTLNNLSSSSIRDIEYSIKAINEQMRGMDRGTLEFKQMTAQAKKLQTELAKVRHEGSAQQSWINRTADFFNKMQGVAIGAVATLTGLSFTIRKCVSDFALMDQEETNVQKYTGQTKKEVEEMNETFKKMDTRTPREKLNQLAGDAGKLGITSKKAIEEFVDGADKISVALGDDLGEDAVKQIGKLAHMFGEDDKIGLRGAMLATGSAVNELAQNSSASADYLVDFTARVSGVGKQAGMTQQQIMGFASVLDQNMQQDETAATTMQNLLTKMFQQPAKFAKLAGKSVKDFSTLLKTDANQAVLTLLQSMKAKGGFASLAPMFDSMKMDGSRATGVLSVMADKLGDIKTAQNLANKSYSQGTSIVKEFNTQMSSEQAKLDMASKKFKEMSIRLGKELLPVARYTVSTAGELVKVLFTTITFVKENIVQIALLTGAMTALIVTYNLGAIKAYLWLIKEEALLVVHKAGVIIMKTKITVITALKLAYFLLTGQITKAKEAMNAMRAASIKNPYTALLVVVLAVAAAVYGLVSALKKNNKVLNENIVAIRTQKETMKALADVKNKANKASNEEITKLKELHRIASSSVYTTNQRREALGKLMKIIPGYTGYISREGRLVEHNIKKYDEYIQKLQDVAVAQAYQNKLVELNDRLIDANTKLAVKSNNVHSVQKELKRGAKTIYNPNNRTQSGITDTGVPLYGGKNDKLNNKKHELDVQQNAKKQAEKDVRIIRNTIRNVVKKMESSKSIKTIHADMVTNGDDNNPGSSDIGTGDISKGGKNTGNNDKNDKFKSQIDEQIVEAKLAYAKGETDYRTYVLQMQKIKADDIAARKAFYRVGTDDYKKACEDEKQMEIDNITDSQDRSEKDIAKEKEITEAKLKAMYYDPNSDIYQNNEALNEALYMNDVSAMSDRLALYKKGSEEYMNLQNEITKLEETHQLDKQKSLEEKLKDIREEYAAKSDEELENIEISNLETIHNAKLVSEEEFQKLLAAIKKKYQDKADGNDSKKNSYGSDDLEKLGKFGDLVRSARKAYAYIDDIMSASSSYAQACADYETEKITKSYEKQIDAAGNNSKKKEKLEKERDEKIRKVKTKANQKAMKIEVAQALASTAFNAISAYGAVLQKGQPWTVPLAIAAAAAATVSGLLQVATIKKQHQTEELGYYEGGFTPGSDYRKRAGVVHEGEFVANHMAVGNSSILPALQLIDMAQRNNTVGSLTATDVTRSLGQGAATVVSPIVNVSGDNEVLNSSISGLNDVIQQLNTQLASGITAVAAIDGRNGIAKQLDHYNQLLKNK